MQTTNVVVFTLEECLEEDEHPHLAQSINVNDTFGWGLAWFEYVPDEELPEVARLFSLYGKAGLYYWVSERNDKTRSEFFPINRMIDFVSHEERVIKELGYWTSKWAYHKEMYTIYPDPQDNVTLMVTPPKHKTSYIITIPRWQTAFKKPTLWQRFLSLFRKRQ